MSAGMGIQVVGNNIRDQFNKMKTRQGGGMEATGPEFRPVQGDAPEQTSHQNSGFLDTVSGNINMDDIKNMAKNNQDAQGAAKGAQAAGAAQGAGAAAAASDERIKEPTNTTDMISEVAQMINNYTYHYKPGVGEDPSVEYSGPMAQELLQVDGYRSCVFEDNGILKVDTGRLALVNAGMIADLSKRLLMLEEFVKAVVGSFQELMPDVS